MPIDYSSRDDGIKMIMQGFPPLPNNQALLANWREPDIARWSFNHLRQLLPTASIRAADQPIKIVEARQDLDDLSFLDALGDRQQLSKYLSAS